MGTKQVRLDEDVYARIADKKREDETFSEAIDRLTSDWTLTEWAQKYDSDGEVIEEAITELDETDREDTAELLDRMDVGE